MSFPLDDTFPLDDVFPTDAPPITPTAGSLLSVASDYLYEPGTGLEVPGIEAVLEYGDASTYDGRRIPGALRVNDRSKPDQVHVTELSGLHDAPDVTDSRTERAGRFGERAGLLFPRGRTVGVTGYVKAGNVGRMRDLWRRTRAQFGRVERDLIVHPPGETVLYRNETIMDVARWTAAIDNPDPGTISPLASYTEGNLTGIQHQVNLSFSAPNSLVLLSKDALPWSGQDVWITALVKPQAAAAAVASLTVAVYCCDDNDNLLVVWYPPAVPLTSPTTGTYYRVAARLFAFEQSLPGTRFYPAVVMNTAGTSGTFTMRAAQVATVLINAQDPSPAGYFNGATPGYEWEEFPGASRSYGPCYAVNQVHDPDATSTTLTANNSTSGTVADVAGAVVRSWPEEGRSSIAWTIRNPSTASRVFSIRSPATLADPDLYVVTGGRSYRVHVRALIKESFSSGTLGIVWLDHALSVVSASLVDSFDPVASGATPVDDEFGGVVVAPPLAQRAYMVFSCASSSTTSGNKLSVQLTDLRFLDVSDHDEGVVAIDATQAPEHGISQFVPSFTGGVLGTARDGARRRIPRPFLIRSVRALWDGKAPESQRSLSARRDFTMSLRATDPLIYSLDDRHASVRASGTPKLVSYPMSTFRALLNAAPTPVASDNFNSATPASALNGRTADLGGSWVTSGSTGDFDVVDLNVYPINRRLAHRSTSGDTGPRWAVLGSTGYTAMQVDLLHIVGDWTSGDTDAGVFARWVDSSNYLRAVENRAFSTSGGVAVTTRTLVLTQRVAGTETVLGSIPVPVDTLLTLYAVRLVVYASGRVRAWLMNETRTTTLGYIEAMSTALTTGGALATGKPGIYDKNTITGHVNGRYYDDFVASTVPAGPDGAPAGFTAMDVSADVKVGWCTDSDNGPYVRNGVGLGRIGTYTGMLSQDSLERAYRSQEGYTYTTPQVTVAGDVVDTPNGYDYNLFTDSLIGGSWQYNYLAAVIKRVNSTTWLELRYNSANSVTMNAAHASPAAPSSLELWCSHNASGTLTTTRLDAWDVPTSEVTSGALKFVRGYMTASNQVFMELWGGTDPNPGDIGLISRRSYALSSGLQALLGAAVAGSTGFGIRLARWGDGTASSISLEKMANNYGFPYLASFESIDYAASQMWLSCPVIGDADEVPWQLQLRGDLVAPTIVLISFGEETRSSTMRLSGTLTEADPVTIDSSTGKIRSASGANYFSARQPGSRFDHLAAGQNFVLIQAASWDTAANVHAIATWKDALI